MTRSCMAVGLVAIVLGGLVSADSQAPTGKSAAAAAVKAILKDRVDTEKWLRADPTSYNCPVPPKENTLRVAIRAGEMDSHYH